MCQGKVFLDLVYIYCFLLVMLGLISCMDLSNAKPGGPRIRYPRVASRDCLVDTFLSSLFFAPALYLSLHLEKIPLFSFIDSTGKKIILRKSLSQTIHCLRRETFHR